MIETVDKITRTILGTFIIFIGWATIAIAMSFAPFTHTLTGVTRVFVVLPISAVFGISAGIVITYGLFMVLGVCQVPRNISFTHGGK